MKVNEEEQNDLWTQERETPYCKQRNQHTKKAKKKKQQQKKKSKKKNQKKFTTYSHKYCSSVFLRQNLG